MNKSIEELFKKMKEDKSFAEGILTQTEKEKVIELAKAEGIDLTLEDIDEANAIILKGVQAKQEGELSEEELENVAGGFLLEAIAVSVLTTAIASASTAVSAAGSAGLSAGVTAASVGASIISAMTYVTVTDPQ